jgi:hypothetical protein
MLWEGCADGFSSGSVIIIVSCVFGSQHFIEKNSEFGFEQSAFLPTSASHFR